MTKECSGVYDDGVAQGNLTKCSTSDGCGLSGCKSTGATVVSKREPPSNNNSYKTDRGQMNGICHPTVLAYGKRVLTLHGPSSALLNAWIAEIASKTKTMVDWYFCAGIAVILVIDDGDAIARVMEEINQSWPTLLVRHLASNPTDWVVRKEVENNLYRKDIDA